MCELFAMSSRLKTSVSFSLKEFSQHGGKTAHHCDGWGLASYNEKVAQIQREAKAAAFSQKMNYFVTNHQKSTCIISHLRRATIGERALRNTQPFVKIFQGRSHVFAHNGDLKGITGKLTFKGCKLEGETDSEYAFCYLLANLKLLWEKGTPTLKQRARIIEKIFQLFATFGPANFLYSEGDYLYLFSNKRTQANGRIEPPGMYYLQRECKRDNDALMQEGITISQPQQKVLLFASVPLTNERWQPLTPGKLYIASTGQFISDPV